MFVVLAVLVVVILIVAIFWREKVEETKDIRDKDKIIKLFKELKIGNTVETVKGKLGTPHKRIIKIVSPNLTEEKYVWYYGNKVLKLIGDKGVLDESIDFDRIADAKIMVAFRDGRLFMKEESGLLS